MGLRPILLSLLSTYAHAKDQGSVKSSMGKMKKIAAIENKNDGVGGIDPVGGGIPCVV